MPPRLGVLLIFLLIIANSNGEEDEDEYVEDWFGDKVKIDDLYNEKPLHVPHFNLNLDKRFTDEDRLRYKEKVKSMFYHAYDGYLQYGYPKDELKPLTCEGHDTWGSFSLTLVDALDTLLVMGNDTEFRRASRLVLESVRTRADINVSVFETNIRIVGGLLTAHMFQHLANDTTEGWPCDGPLLRLAHEMAERLLPAFNTDTGMPYGTVNLKYGVHKDETPITCTAGVGTYILEFGALSRLTGDERFEKVAMRALESLFMSKSPIGLVGNHINVITGKWTATDAGIGAGVDSYFEYLVKGALLFRRPRLMKHFYDLEEAILKYVRKKDWFHWVSMTSGTTTLPIFQSLEAFWPGMMTLVGEVGDAYRILMNYASLIDRYGFPPEFYRLDSRKPYEGREAYPLRPEMVESIMYLYRATGDTFLLKLGAIVVDSIEASAKTECGYATVNTVTREKENRMESFFLAETTKYLYLLFDNDNFLHSIDHGKVIETKNGPCAINAGGYIYNTEAHPLDPGIIHCCSKHKAAEKAELDRFFSDENVYNMVKDSLNNGGVLGGKFAKLTVESISEETEELLQPEKSDYIRRQYGSDDIEFEIDESLKPAPRVSVEDEDDESLVKELKEMIKEEKEKDETDMYIENESSSPGRLIRKRQRERDGPMMRMELGRFEWKKEDENIRLREESIKQAMELIRQARSLDEQRRVKGVKGVRVSLDVLQAVESIAEEMALKPFPGRISSDDLQNRLIWRAAVERVIAPYVEITNACVPLDRKGYSPAARSFQSIIHSAHLYRNRGWYYVLGPVCWKSEQPTVEDNYKSAEPDMSRYFMADESPMDISIEYDDPKWRRAIEEENQLLLIRPMTFAERLMADGHVIPTAEELKKAKERRKRRIFGDNYDKNLKEQHP